MSQLRKKTILHIFSGDLWAGAEVMVFNLLNRLKDDPELEIIALSLNEGVLSDKLRRAGLETYVIPERKHSFTIIFLKAIGLLGKRRIDCIHTHRYKENLLGLLLSKVLGAKKLITTMHGMSEHRQSAGKGDDDDERLSLSTKINYYMLKKQFTDVITVSNEMKETLTRKFGFTPENVKVIHNGIPFPQPLSLPVSTPFFHIGTVGRMVPIKDYDLFL